MIIVTDVDSIRIITLNHPNKHNPFSEQLEYAIKTELKKADLDDRINAIIIYGGKNRSFSSGGDFNEVKKLSGGDEIDRWIDRVIDLYTTVLNVSKPTVAAVDGYAIGMGFQFAMMFDARLMSTRAIFCMPELKHGIGCSVGASILKFTHGFSLMRKIIFECKDLSAEVCLQYNIVDKLTSEQELLNEAFSVAKKISEYPKVAFSNTKSHMNNNFICALKDAEKTSKLVHQRSFGAKDAQKHFKEILRDKY
ncbi:enoyl-CoA hydratase/isomerase family protein [Rouxiella sp. S1S-2]|uniref:enoyl-CoA hydratase/isomerase family protein n=1 Tax=Rouxiella sp. S1S-2 TaxID=2653856 RepID=UPI001265A97D|nr:enoyl-CoA hydratase/isomerase family protein [Rouxiella sp. S1S-2]KAB7894856.1 enoyl-CoA hydratase/isomerase family protein [Rouxiella sp. S1S-2]